MDKGIIAVDAIALVMYLAAANPIVTGVATHEWIGLGIFVALFVHLAMHADWIVDAVRSAFAHPSAMRTGRLVVSILLLIVTAACVISGVLVSGAILPSCGFYASGYYFWDPLHATSAKIMLALLIVHIALHAKWIAGLLKGKGFGHDE